VRRHGSSGSRVNSVHVNVWDYIRAAADLISIRTTTTRQSSI
jgi:hypothetical protein